MWPFSREPKRVKYRPELAEKLEALIKEGEVLYTDPEMEDPAFYSRGVMPDVHAAMALKAIPYAKWFSSSMAFLEAICGTGHSYVKCFFWWSESAVIDGAMKGVGVLRGAKEHWERGTLWRAEDPRDIGRSGGRP